MASRVRTAKIWKDSAALKYRDHSNQVRLKARILYFVRFICAGDSADSMAAFGCLSTQISYLSIALRLDVAETAAFAISYDSEVMSKLRMLSRKRNETVDFAKP